MKTVRISDRDQLVRLADEMRRVVEGIDSGDLYQVTVAVDDIDKAAKFKANNYPWGPPCSGEMR